MHLIDDCNSCVVAVSALLNEFINQKNRFTQEKHLLVNKCL